MRTFNNTPFSYMLCLVSFLHSTNEGLAFGFAGLEPSLLHATSMNEIATSASALVETFQSQQLTIAADSTKDINLLLQYKNLLVSNPLETKMATGGVLAVAGDAIAQSRDKDEDYDKRRAFSFMCFDMCYRALQHGSFPIIVQQCQGQYIGGLLAAIGLSSTFQSYFPIPYMAAMEQTLASQLGIVPFLYYPVFFSLTGIVQGLNAEQSIERAKENFIPLMKRNLLFWIPVQFVQFGFIEEGLQIPFLSVCGLAWTFILSIAAGSTKNYTDESVELDDIKSEIAADVEKKVSVVQKDKKLISR